MSSRISLVFGNTTVQSGRGVTLTDGEQKRVGRGVLFLDGNIQKSRLNFNRNALLAVPQLGAGKSYIAFRW